MSSALAIVLGLTVALAGSIVEFGHTDVRATLSISALPLPAHTGPAGSNHREAAAVLR